MFRRVLLKISIYFNLTFNFLNYTLCRFVFQTSLPHRFIVRSRISDDSLLFQFLGNKPVRSFPHILQQLFSNAKKKNFLKIMFWFSNQSVNFFPKLMSTFICYLSLYLSALFSTLSKPFQETSKSAGGR